MLIDISYIMKELDKKNLNDIKYKEFSIVKNLEEKIEILKKNSSVLNLPENTNKQIYTDLPGILKL